MAIVLPLDFCYTCEKTEAVARVKFHDDGAIFYLCKECLKDCVCVIDAFDINADISSMRVGSQISLI